MAYELKGWEYSKVHVDGYRIKRPICRRVEWEDSNAMCREE